jgi:hypothetical protein
MHKVMAQAVVHDLLYCCEYRHAKNLPGVHLLLSRSYLECDDYHFRILRPVHKGLRNWRTCIG